MDFLFKVKMQVLHMMKHFKPLDVQPVWKNLIRCSSQKMRTFPTRQFTHGCK